MNMNTITPGQTYTLDNGREVTVQWADNGWVEYASDSGARFTVPRGKFLALVQRDH